MPREPRTASGQTSARALLRAALLGLSGGLLIGGILLLILGVYTRLNPALCDDLSGEECTFKQDADAAIGKVQGISGAALLALGLATAVLSVRMKSDTPTPGRAPWRA